MSGDGEKTNQGERYRRHKARAAEAQAQDSRAGRDIGDLPPVANPQRKDSCRRNLKLFLETYLPHHFPLAWSPDHETAIARAQACVLEGGLFAYAMPRGSGKTTLVEGVVIWCACYGHRPFVPLIGADEAHSVAMLDNVKIELETNDDLAADFPEVCVPIRELEGRANRAKGQLYKGERTYIVWREKEIVLPTIPGSAASGCRVRTRGITGRIRGMIATLPDGRRLRPSMVVIDDPQTHASASSVTQCKKRLRVLTGDILGLPGPDETIAALMPCTVIQPGDVADQILDTGKYPQWHGLRTKLIYAWPTNEELWNEYARLRTESMRLGNDGREATEFYSAHRAEMDAGSQVGWEQRYAVGELSAIQHAYNLLMDLGREAFDAEYQNDPKAEDSEVVELTFDQICEKANGIARGVVPNMATDLVAYIDCHSKLLYWMVGAFDRGFTGQIVDYRAFPDQRRQYFRMSEAKTTLATQYPGARLEGQIHAGLDDLVNRLMETEWPREDGGMMTIGRIFIDSGWGQTSDTVKDFCRRSRHAAVVLPSQGKGIGAAQTPMAEWPRHEGETCGFHWVLRRARKPPKGKKAQGGRLALLDVNFWKTFVHERLGVAKGDRGGLTLFGDDPQTHLMLAHHLRSESRKRKAVPGRVVDEWFLPPDKPDNHLFDCACGIYAAASNLGCLVTVPGMARQPRKKTKPKPRRSRVHYAE